MLALVYQGKNLSTGLYFYDQKDVDQFMSVYPKGKNISSDQSKVR